MIVHWVSRGSRSFGSSVNTVAVSLEERANATSCSPQRRPKADGPASTGSEKVTSTLASRGTFIAPLGGLVAVTRGGWSPGESVSSQAAPQAVALLALGPVKSLALLSVSTTPSCRSKLLSPLTVGIVRPVPSLQTLALEPTWSSTAPDTLAIWTPPLSEMPVA